MQTGLRRFAYRAHSPHLWNAANKTVRLIFLDEPNDNRRSPEKGREQGVTSFQSVSLDGSKNKPCASGSRPGRRRRPVRDTWQGEAYRSPLHPPYGGRAAPDTPRLFS